MGKIKHDPKQYLRRSDIGVDPLSVSQNRKAKTKTSKSLLNAVIDTGFYIDFKPSTTN